MVSLSTDDAAVQETKSAAAADYILPDGTDDHISKFKNIYIYTPTACYEVVSAQRIAHPIPYF